MMGKGREVVRLKERIEQAKLAVQNIEAAQAAGVLVDRARAVVEGLRRELYAIESAIREAEPASRPRLYAPRLVAIDRLKARERELTQASRELARLRKLPFASGSLDRARQRLEALEEIDEIEREAFKKLVRG